MPSHQPHFNPAEALGDHLADRVRTAARALALMADALAVESTPVGGYSLAAVELRALLHTVIEHAISHDLYAGPGIGAVSNALKVSERTVRARYDLGPREVPLFIALNGD